MLPHEAPLVIVGAGIVGASVAHHLALRGWRDVVIVDQGPIPVTGGSTSHAPGGVFATNYSRMMTRFALDTVELLADKEIEGEPCFHRVGTIEVARTRERLEDLKRKAGVAQSWGVPASLLGPDDTRELLPLIDRERIQGSYHVPVDGIAKPIRSVSALLQAAQASGFQLAGETEVTGFRIDRGRLHGIDTTRGHIQTPQVVLCGGIWGPLLGRLLDVTVPLVPCEHQYVITGPVQALADETREVVHPMLRDQDRAMYYRQHFDRYGVGSYQHEPLIVDPARIRRHDASSPEPRINPHGEAANMPSLTPFTPEHFEAPWRDAQELLPALRDTVADYRINGMFSFTPDGYPILGPVKAVEGAWLAEAVWVTHAGGVGRVIADWLTDGDPGMDVHEAHIDRFEPVQKTRRYLELRGRQNYDEVYDIIHPAQPITRPRAIRTSPFQPRLEALGGQFFEGRGWERAQWYDANPLHPTASRSGWAERYWNSRVVTEHLDTRARVALFDLTSLTRIEIAGRDAATFLQRLAAGDVDRPVGSVKYTVLCTEAGGIRSDVTVTRLGDETYQVGLNGPIDVAYLQGAISADERVEVRETTSGTCAVGVWGPRSRALLSSVTQADLSNEAFPYMTARSIEIQEIPVLAQRLSYVGELGWEIYAEAAVGLRLWDVLWEAGEHLGVLALGRGAFDSMRLEKGYRLWGVDMDTEDGPYEAGIGFAVQLKKAGGFTGREALLRKREAGLSRGLAMLALDDPTAVVLGKEPVLVGSEVVGYVRSAATAPSLGVCLATAMLPGALLAEGTALEIEWFGERLRARVIQEPPFDPSGSRLRQ